MASLKRFPRLLAAILSALASTFILAGCKSTQSGTEQAFIEPSPDTLRIGITPNMPPFAFKENGQLRGLEIDFALLLANELGREALFIEMEWEELIPALQTNRIDIIMSGMSFTPERSAIVLFTEPYLRSGQKALVRRRDASDFTFPGLIARTDKRVGVEKGTTGEFLVQEAFKNAKLRTFPSAEEGSIALIENKIDLFIHDAPTVLWMAGLYQNQGLTAALPVLSEDLNLWAVSRRTPALAEVANAAIRKWTADGTLSVVLRQWILL